MCCFQLKTAASLWDAWNAMAGNRNLQEAVGRAPSLAGPPAPWLGLSRGLREGMAPRCGVLDPWDPHPPPGKRAGHHRYMWIPSWIPP